VAAFHDAHQRLYGYSFRDDPTQQVEWVNLRVTGIGPIRRPTLRPLTGRGAGDMLQRPPSAGGAPEGDVLQRPPSAGGAPEREGSRPERDGSPVVHTPTPTSTRPACFDPAHGFVDTAIYHRDDLSPGDVVAGPAVVEEYGATVPLLPGFRAEVDRFGNLIVTREGAGEPGGVPRSRREAP
jgi:N-methylhydantoinase A